MLADEICKHATGIAGQRHAAEIRVGLGYTAVALDDGRCGLAYTLHEKEYESCTVIEEAGTLAGRKAAELLAWITRPDVTAAAVGLATASALADIPETAAESDILETLPVRADDAVGMIGYFGPLVESLRKRSRSFHVFERKPLPDYGILPESAAPAILPGCQIVVISSTTLLNGTIDGLLDLCSSARDIVLLGPSTPFLPEVLAPRGVTMLSGVQVVDAPRVMRIVSEGGGTRKFGRAVRKLTLRIRN